MKKTILFLFILLASSQLFALVNDILNDSTWTYSDPYVYKINRGAVTLYEVDSSPDGRRVLRYAQMDEKFWKGYESERDLYNMENAKKRGAFILGPVALVSFALVAGISSELRSPELALIASGAGAFLLTINMFTITSKTNRRKEEILRRRLGAPSQTQTQLKLTGSANGIGVSLQL